MFFNLVKGLRRWATVILLLLSVNLFGQSVANYTPASSTGITYTSISSTGNSVTSWRNNVSNQNDDNRSNPISIGFDFWYLGTRYTAVSISTNGFIDFSGATYDGNTTSGATAILCNGAYAYREDPVAFSTSGCAATPPTTYSGTYIALAPMYTDLWVSGGTASLSSSIKYRTTGTAPNRVFTAEYINFDDFVAGTASFNFQVKLYETTGKIEFVYGTMTGPSGGTVTSNYTLGINNSTMSTTPAATELLVQQTENSGTFSNVIRNNLTTFPVSNSMISFTSNVPANPSGSLTFTSIGKTAMTLNWTDWASNENGYVIYNSTDGVNYTFASQSAANATSLTVSGLTSSTTYFWRIYAVTEGNLSSALSATQATQNAGNFVSTQTGPWNTGSTWVGGIVPSAGDNATIATGHTVTIDGNNSVNNLTINGTLLIGNNTTARTFAVTGNVTIAGSFASSSAATHSATFSGNITNNGSFNMAPGGGSLTNVTFNRNGNQTISGTGATTTFNLITANLGSSNTNILEFTCSNFSAATNFLTLTNGTFKFSVPTNAVTLNMFPAAVTIAGTTAIVMNSPNSTMNFQNTTTFQGDLTLITGTLNAGDAANENLLCDGGNITINGGTLTVAGRFSRPSIVSITNFVMTSGTLIVNTLGSNDSAPPAGPPATPTSYPFMMDVPGSKFNVTAGTIIIRRSGNGASASNLGFNCTNLTDYTFSGGTLQLGDASTPGGTTMQLSTDQIIPNLTIYTTNSPTVQLVQALTIANTLSIQTGATLNCQNNSLTLGGSLFNDGTYTAGTNTTTFNGTSSVAGATNTTFNNVLITGTLNGHVVNMNVAGSWTNNGGTFNPGNALVTFTTNSAAAITGTSAAQNFNNLTVNKSGGSLSVTASTTTLTLAGNFLLTVGTFVAPTNGFFNVGGNFTHTTGTYTANGSTITFNGTAAQTINGGVTTETWGSMVINKTAATTLNTGGSLTTITLGSDFTQTQGNFTAPANFNIAGNWTHDAGTFTPGSGTVTFNGTGTQTISSSALTTEGYNNLVINKSAGTTLSTSGTLTTINVAANYTNTQGNFTLPATMNVTGNVTLTAGTITAGTSIDVKGNWTYNTGSTFTPGTGTVSFTGTGAQQINGSVANSLFNNLTVNKTAATVLSTGGSATTVTVQGNYTQTLGNFTAPATLNVGGNWVHDAGTFTFGTGTVVFNGSANQVMSSAALTSETFYALTVNKSGGTLSVSSTFTTVSANSNFINTQGNFTLPATFNVTGNVTLTAGTVTAGTLVDSKGNWTNNGGTFTPGSSTVQFTGTGTQNLNGSATTQTFNNFTINKSNNLVVGGSTATLNILGNYTQTAGTFQAFISGVTNVGGNWVHDAGTFTPSSGTVTFNGTGAQSISSSSLGTETFYNLRINKTSGAVTTGSNPVTITLTNNYQQTQGDFTPPATLNVAGNWTHDAGTFTPGTGLVNFNGGSAQLISSAALTTESFYNMTVNKGGNALSTSTITTISVANNYVNTNGTFTAPATVNVGNNVTISAGTVTAGSLIDVKGNWALNGGTFTPGTGEVSFTGTGAQQISGVATQTFYNLTVNKAVSTLLNTAANPTTITVTNNYLQSAGNFTPPATLNIGGNWTHNAGTYTPGSGLINFNGTGNQTISSTAFTSEAFYNFTVNKASGTLNTGGTLTNIDINQTFTFTAGTFTAPATMTVFVNWTRATGTTFTPGTGSVTFDGTGSQTINGTIGSQTFYDLIVNKTTGTALTVGGSTTTLSVHDYTNTLGNFTSPATFNVTGSVLLTAGVYTTGANTFVGGDWTRNGGTFTPGTNTVTFNGSALQQNINGAQSTTFGRLTFNNTFATSPQVVVGTPVFVNTAMTMTAGIVQTSATNLIQLASGATSTIGSSASFISGPLQFNMASNGVTTSLNFPIGKNNLYGGATLSIRHSAATSYTYTAEVIHSSAIALNYTPASSTTHVSGLRYWDIKRGTTAAPLTTDNTNITTGANGPRITLYYETADQVNDPTNLTIVKNIGGGTAWFDIGGTASGAAPGNIAMSASSTNFTSFSFFSLANKTGGANILPITLLDFTARQSGSEVFLNWTTETEIDNDRFEIERLADGEKFSVIGTVKGAGNSVRSIGYSFTDRKPLTGKNYYRLNQIDFDGTSTRTKVVSVDFVYSVEGLTVRVFPNPVSPEGLNLMVTGASASNALTLRIFDMSGRVVTEQNVTVDGTATLNWEFRNPLAPGMYIVQGSQGYLRAQDKIIVK